MANIRAKDIHNLTDWNEKELRKLKITINNRMKSLEGFGKEKSLPDSHPLQGLELGECRDFLAKVIKAEKALK